ncbi:MAG TPA: hypothetical protein DCE41_35445 [Cytophagales bacterium]|nr:hypothetical protein [Cytophagales bacterium]
MPWIKEKTAKRWAKAYKKWKKKEEKGRKKRDAVQLVESAAFNKNDIERLMAQEGAAGVRFYFGFQKKDGKGKRLPEPQEQVFVVAVDAKGKDILENKTPEAMEPELKASLESAGIPLNQGLILDQAALCPPFCGGGGGIG